MIAPNPLKYCVIVFFAKYYPSERTFSFMFFFLFQRFGAGVKIVHFIGSKKPWQYNINLETGKVIHDDGIISVTSSERFVQQWWDFYNEIAAHRITVSFAQFILQLNRVFLCKQCCHTNVQAKCNRFEQVDCVINIELNDNLAKLLQHCTAILQYCFHA